MRLLFWVTALAVLSISWAKNSTTKTKPKRQLDSIRSPQNLQYSLVLPHSRVAHFRSLTSNRRISTGTPKGKLPSYAVQMEPVVQYSQKDPLYDPNHNNVDDLVVNKNEIYAQSKILNVQDQSVESSFGPPYGSLPTAPLYSQDPHRQYYDAPEPIIEIIIKESNESLPAPPPPPIQKKKKEPVHVFYVKYSKDPNSKDKVVYDKPIPAITPPSNEEDDHHEEYVTVTPEPVYTPAKTTTLRAIIKPESEVYHSHSNVKITFGNEGRHYTDKYEGDFLTEDREETAPHPAIAFPNQPLSQSHQSLDRSASPQPQFFESSTRPTIYHPTPSPQSYKPQAQAQSRIQFQQHHIPSEQQLPKQGPSASTFRTQSHSRQPFGTAPSLIPNPAFANGPTGPVFSNPTISSPIGPAFPTTYHRTNPTFQTRPNAPLPFGARTHFNGPPRPSFHSGSQRPLHFSQSQVKPYFDEAKYLQENYHTITTEQIDPTKDQLPPSRQPQIFNHLQQPSPSPGHFQEPQRRPPLNQQLPQQKPAKQFAESSHNKPLLSVSPSGTPFFNLKPSPPQIEDNRAPFHQQTQQQFSFHQGIQSSPRPPVQLSAQHSFSSAVSPSPSALPSNQFLPQPSSPTLYNFQPQPSPIPEQHRFQQHNSPSERPFIQQSHGPSESPFQQFQNPSERPFQQSHGPSERPFHQLHGPSERPFQQFQSPSERPFQQSHGPSERPFQQLKNPSESPFQQSHGPSERPFQQPHGPSERPFQQSQGPSERPSFNHQNNFQDQSNLQHQQNIGQFIPNGGELVPAISKYEQHFTVNGLSDSSPSPTPHQPQQQYHQIQQQSKYQNHEQEQVRLQLAQNVQKQQEEIQRLQAQLLLNQQNQQIYESNYKQVQNDYNQQVQATSPRSQYIQERSRSQSTVVSSTSSPPYYQSTSRTVDIKPTTQKYVSSTPNSIDTTPEAKKEEKKKKPTIELPDEVPDDLRQQLLSSGILDNADISVLDYDKVGETPLESLPPDQLANFFSAGGGQQIAASENRPVFVKPNGARIQSRIDEDMEEDQEGAASENVPSYVATPSEQKQTVEMKVVQFDPATPEGQNIAKSYVSENATQTDPVALNDKKYNRYLPLKVSGNQFPLPDILKGKKITSVVVLAPVETETLNSEQPRTKRETNNDLKGIKFVAGESLQDLLKHPTKDNFEKWLKIENKTASDLQSIVLLVAGQDADPEEREVFMYDIGSSTVNKLSGELSNAFLEAAENNSLSKDIESLAIEGDGVPENFKKDSNDDIVAEGSENVPLYVDSSGSSLDQGNGNRVSISSGYSKTKHGRSLRRHS